jgi:hypothetical protein
MGELINLNTALIKAETSIKVSNKLLGINRNCKSVIIYNIYLYNRKNKKKSLLIKFVLRNFWHFISLILTKFNSDKNTEVPIPNILIELLLQEVTYEYPCGCIHIDNIRTSIETGKSNLVCFYFDSKKENNSQYTTTELNKELKAMIIECFDRQIIGNVLFRFVNTSIGEIWGLKMKNEF